MKIKSLTLSAFSFFAMLFMASCGSTYMVNYDLGLTSVETPSDIKNPYGDTHITKVSEESKNNKNKTVLINKYAYTDKYIGITWWYNTTQFHFELKNLSNHALKINWDDVTFMNYDGTISKVMHEGVRYIERGESQGSISIPKGGTLQDIIVPNSNVRFNGGVVGFVPAKWEQLAIIPCYYTKKKQMEADIDNKVWIGKKVSILLPIEIEGVKNDYTFEFTVNGTY